MSVSDPAAAGAPHRAAPAGESSQKQRGSQHSKARQSLLLLGGLLILAVGGAAFAAQRSLPALKAEDVALLRAFPPRTLPQLAAQRDVLKRYAAAAPCSVLAGYCAAYVLMQTFAVPGTIMLSLLAGGLYGTWRGAALVAVVSTAGSCSCYCLSWVVGQPLARAAWAERVDKFAAEVGRRRHQLFNYIIFLRVTPMPNTFINVASPIVGVPLAPFALGTLLGCLPNNFVAVNAGSHLGDLTSLSDLYSGRLLALGAAEGVVALAPMLLQSRHAAQVAAAAAAGKLA